MSKLSTVGPRLLVLACVALAASTRAQQCVDGVPEHYPHPTDCNLYYTCVGNTPVEQQCPAGLWYDPSTGNCDYPANVVCGADTSTSTTTSPTTTPTTVTTTPTTVTTTSTPFSSTTPTTSFTTSPTSSSTATTSQLPTEGPPLPPKDCPAVDDPDKRVRYAHETDCKLYYLCTSGVPVTYTCIAGYEFNPLHKLCYPIEEAGCSRCPVKDVAGETVRLPHETVCHYYYLCTEGAVSLYQCVADVEHFSRIDRLCLPPAEAYCQLPNDAVMLR